MLGVVAQLGRVFDASDEQPGITEVAVISDALWQRRFGGDRQVLGKRIRIDNDMYSIIGVAPKAFRHPGRGTATDVEIWRRPVGWHRPSRRSRSAHLYCGWARTAQGWIDAGPRPAAPRRARRETATGLSADYPPGNGWAPRIIPLHDDLVGDARHALLTLLAAVGCAAHRLREREPARALVGPQRGIAIRRALALAARVVRQLLTERAAGGRRRQARPARSCWCVDALVQLSPSSLPSLQTASVDGRSSRSPRVCQSRPVCSSVSRRRSRDRVELQSVMRDASRRQCP
jgi:hypothetical protein